MKVECENLSEREARTLGAEPGDIRDSKALKMKGGRKFSWSYRLPLK